MYTVHVYHQYKFTQDQKKKKMDVTFSVLGDLSQCLNP